MVISTGILDFLKDLVKDAFDALWDFITDIFISILELFLNAVSSLIDLIPLPDFLTSGFNGILANFPPTLLYIIDKTNFNAALAIVLSGVGFRLIRKAVTIGQW